MFDTLTLFLPGEIYSHPTVTPDPTTLVHSNTSLSENDLYEYSAAANTTELTTPDSEIIPPNTLIQSNYYTNCNSTNFKFRNTPRGIILSGSLNKFHKGNNIINMSFQDAKDAIEKLSDNLSLSFENAIVYRIDFSANYIMSYPPNAYYSHLGDLSRFDRRPYRSTTLYYTNKRKTLIFYDKTDEQKKNKVQIPVDSIGKNILRYELRYKKRLSQIFNRNSIPVNELTNADFYRNLLLDYKKTYHAIHKIKNIVLSANEKFSVNDLQNEVLRQGLLSMGGETGILQMVKNSHSMGRLNYKQLTRLRDQLKGWMQIKSIAEQSELIVELNEKIENHVKEALDSL